VEVRTGKGHGITESVESFKKLETASDMKSFTVEAANALKKWESQAMAGFCGTLIADPNVDDRKVQLPTKTELDMSSFLLPLFARDLNEMENEQEEVKKLKVSGRAPSSSRRTRRWRMRWTAPSPFASKVKISQRSALCSRRPRRCRATVSG
jgi:hypothetical protein